MKQTLGKPRKTIIILTKEFKQGEEITIGVLSGVAQCLDALLVAGATFELSFLRKGGGGGILCGSLAGVKLINLLKDFGVDLISFIKSKLVLVVIGVKLFSLSTSRGILCLVGENGNFDFLE